MSLSVKFVSPWEYWEDPDGNARRHIPAGLVIELTDDVAAAAIFDGAAVAVGIITADVQARIDGLKQFEHDIKSGADLDTALENMNATLARINAGEAAGDGSGEASGEAGDGASGEAAGEGANPVEPADKPRKRARAS